MEDRWVFCFNQGWSYAGWGQWVEPGYKFSWPALTVNYSLLTSTKVSGNELHISFKILFTSSPPLCFKHNFSHKASNAKYCKPVDFRATVFLLPFQLAQFPVMNALLHCGNETRASVRAANEYVFFQHIITITLRLILRNFSFWAALICTYTLSSLSKGDTAYGPSVISETVSYVNTASTQEWD